MPESAVRVDVSPSLSQGYDRADIERAMLYALKDGEAFTEADVTALLKDHCLQPPFTVKELMRHW